jgi:hypothetical protein
MGPSLGALKELNKRCHSTHDGCYGEGDARPANAREEGKSVTEAFRQGARYVHGRLKATVAASRNSKGYRESTAGCKSAHATPIGVFDL